MNLNDETLGTVAKARTPTALGRYVRHEYGDDDPTWLLNTLRAPYGARSLSRPPRTPRLVALRRAINALSSILL